MNVRTQIINDMGVRPYKGADFVNPLGFDTLRYSTGARQPEKPK